MTIMMSTHTYSFISDAKQSISPHYYPPRTSKGKGFEREARGVVQRTDPANPTDQRAHQVAKSEVAEKHRVDRCKFCSLFLRDTLWTNFTFQ